MSTSASSSLALVTGASRGIGLELARQFARHGFDLLIAAEDVDLAEAAERLRADGTNVTAVQVDLATARGVDDLYAEVSSSGRPLAAAALNAGVAVGGAFATDTELHDELRLIDLNVRSTVHLAKCVLRDMAQRGEGRVLFTSSIAATAPGAYAATYNASRAFVQSFALALRRELAGSGVTVTALLPGPTDTNIFARAGMLDTLIGAAPKDDPADVARMGFEALMAGDERVVAASRLTRFVAAASRFVPDSLKAAAHAQMARPRSSGKH
jgi:uncharacterized protein